MTDQLGALARATEAPNRTDGVTGRLHSTGVSVETEPNEAYNSALGG